jgi:hypothetical protein
MVLAFGGALLGCGVLLSVDDEPGGPGSVSGTGPDAGYEGEGHCGAVDLCPGVDIQGDRSNCGACGRACDEGELCVAGECVSPCAGSANSVGCDDGDGGVVCVDTNTDPQHCGGCGRACPHTCRAGKCGRLVFLSSVLFKASDIVSAQNADEQCRKVAERAGLRDKTFRAWISDGTTSPSASFVRDGPGYLRPDGELVVEDAKKLFDGTLTRPINVHEDGRVVPGEALVWTATKPDGTAADTNPCGGWIESPTSVTIGRSGAVNPTWTYNPNAGVCAITARLYCFEQ